jgi:excisionase family DNA binding protein
MDMPDLISTGQAADLLDCTRSQVVNLCNAGKLPFTRKGGSHRYVRRSDVLALADLPLPIELPLTRDQEQSLWLHGKIAGRLVEEPDLVLSRARENLDRFSKIHAGTMAERWLDIWRQTLGSGTGPVLNMLTSHTPLARELRQNSPFTGILSQDERMKVLDSFRQDWRMKHAI